jgi:AmmeMemoRadiSam system protein B
MKRVSLALLLALFAIGFFWTFSFSGRHAIQKENDRSVLGVHADRVIQPELVQVFPSDEKTKIFVEKQVVGGVVPHHLLAAASLAEFFSALSNSKNPPATIIIIGPNHAETGKGRVITGKYAWGTPFGNLETDVELVDTLVKNGVAVLDEESLENEHAVYSLTTFSKYFLPKTKIVPLALSANLTLNDAKALGKKIAQLAGERTIVVGSIDFSHYLSTERSNQKDQETLEAIGKKDFRLLESYGNDHLDSPDALIAVLSFVEERTGGKNALEMIRHTNSGLMQGKESAPGTSHFELGFFPEE